MKTFLPKITEIQKNRKWFLIDAAGARPGKLATKIAQILLGKNKTFFAPHLDCGDGVIVVNAAKIEFSGDKNLQKKYYSHSGFIGNLKEISAEKLRQKKPVKIIEFAVRGMLPKNRARAARLKRLRVFAKENHDLIAQKPEKIEI